MPIPACATSDLTIRLVRSFAGLSHVGGYIGFTNRSSMTCSLSGWPTLVAVTDAGAAARAVRVRSTWFGPYTKISGAAVPVYGRA